MKQNLGRKTTLRIVSAVLVLVFLVSACSGATEEQLAAAATQAVGTALAGQTSLESTCDGNIGKVDNPAGGSPVLCDGDTYVPRPAETAFCQASDPTALVSIAGAVDKDGQPYQATCELILANAKKFAAAVPTATPTLAPLPTATLALPTLIPTNTAAAPVADPNCADGEETGNNLNKVDRTPVGDKQHSTVQETSNKPGPGTGYLAYYRWISVVGPLGTDRQVFINNVETIHELRYCGSVDQVKAYLMDPNTHIWAMRATAADGAGNMPAQGDIPVVYVDPVNMTVTFLVAGTTPNAPTLDYIKSHIEIVDLNP